MTYHLYIFASGNMYVVDDNNIVVERVITKMDFMGCLVGEKIALRMATKVFSSANLNDVIGYACMETL